jgi:hypothetical protein
MLTTGDNPKTGTLTASSTPAAIAGSTACSAVIVQNDPGSAVNVGVGDSTNQYFQLRPAQAITIPCSNLNKVYVATASGTATVNFLYVL